MLLDEERTAAHRSDRHPAPVVSPEGVLSLGTRRFLAGVGVTSLVLVPWTVQLGLTLPDRYTSAHWILTWIGFDIVLLVALLVTAWLAHRDHHCTGTAATASATLLGCDAWFDITTSQLPGLPLSVGTAVMIEIPLAVVLLWTVRPRRLRLNSPDPRKDSS